MKLIRNIVALLLVAAVASSALAQTTPVTTPKPPKGNKATTGAPANPGALTALQSDLVAAVQAMEAALPIYKGKRVSSIRAAEQALKIVDKAIDKNAPVRDPSKATDQPVPGKKGKNNGQAIKQSQTSMRQGLASLTTAQKDLQTAAGAAPKKQVTQVRNLITKAISAADAAIGQHSKQG
jgi:hypothetical protein